MKTPVSLTVDDLLLHMRDGNIVLTFLQQLFSGQWHAAVRIGAQDFEVGRGATAVAALREALDNADQRRTCEWRSIWTAGRAVVAAPRPAPTPAPAEPAADIFA